MVFNDAYGNPRPNASKKTNIIKKYKNKSVTIENNYKNEIKFEN